MQWHEFSTSLCQTKVGCLACSSHNGGGVGWGGGEVVENVRLHVAGIPTVTSTALGGAIGRKMRNKCEREAEKRWKASAKQW